MIYDKINKELRIILAGAGIVFFGSIINRVLNYAIRILIARGLGVEEYGLFTIAVMIMRIFITFSALGLSEGILRYVSYYRGLNDNERIKGTLIFSFITTFLSSIIITIILFFSSDYIATYWFNSKELIPVLKIFILIIPIGVLATNFVNLNLAYEKIKYNFWLIDISLQSLRVLTIGFAVLFGLGILGVSYFYLISFFMILILMFLISEYKIFPLIKSKIKAKYEIFELFSYSWPLIFVGFLDYLMGWIDTFMIGKLMDVKSVGLYNAALPIANLLTLLPLTFTPLFLPLITKNFASKKMFLVDSLTKNVGKWAFFINFPLLLLMFLFPGFFINLLFGKDYISAASSLIFLSFGFFLFSLSQPSIQLLRMVKKTKLYLINVIISAPINIILNLLFIPKYGISGAALATSISYLIFSLLFIIESYYYLKLVPLSLNFWKPIVAGLITLIVILLFKRLLPLNIYFVILLGIIFFILYLFLLIILKSFDEQDKLLFKFLKSKFSKKEEL